MSKPVLTGKVKFLSAFAVASSVFLGVAAVAAASSTPVDTSRLNPSSYVAAGEDISFAISKSGAAYGRGENEYGQLGDKSYDNRNAWTKVEGDSYKKISAQYDHALALKNDDTLYTWGGNRYGTMIGGTASVTSPKSVTASPVYNDISAGSDFVVAIDRAGHLNTWGKNDSGQLGDGTTNGSTKPIIIAPNMTFTEVKAGKNYVIALDAQKHIWAWGNNDAGQLGTGNTKSLNVPTKISDQPFKFINTSPASQTSIAIDINGGLYTWGDNSNGQIGNGSDWRLEQQLENERVQRQIDAIKAQDEARRQGLINQCQADRQSQLDNWQQEQDEAQAKADAEAQRKAEQKAREDAKNNPSPSPTASPTGNPTASPTESPSPTAEPTPTPSATADPVPPTRPKPSWDTTCAQDVDKDFKATDTSNIKPKTIPEPKLNPNALAPTRIIPSILFTAAATGSQNAYAVDVLGRLYGWGSDNNGQSGLGITDSKTHTQVPVLITSSNANFTKVEAGDKVAAAVSQSGLLYTWGSGNKTGTLGNGKDSQNAPTVLRDNVKDVFLGAKTAYIIDGSNSVFSWGYGAQGLLGNGKNGNAATPQNINQKANTIAISGQSVVALDTVSELVTWGNNSNGTFGNGETLDKVAGPTKNTISKFEDIASGKFFSVALDKNGNVWAWGYSGFKQVGPYSEAIQTNRPVPVNLNVKVKFVAASAYNGFAVGVDNSVWTWGSNDPNPKNIGKTDTDVKQVSAGSGNLAVLDKDGNIWEWGHNSRATYRIFTHDTLTKLTETNTKYSYVASGGQTTVAITDKGSLVGWGDNSNNQLLQGDKKYIGTQVTIDKTRNYKMVSVSSTHALALDTKNAVYAWGTEPYGTFGNQAGSGNKVQVLPLYATQKEGK
jgi:alpha-tubulin suppressor-like RCC1 family protein